MWPGCPHGAPRRRTFDWPHRRFRSGEAWSFYEKPLMFLGNQPALQRPSQNILQITPQIIFKSTRSPERMSSGFFAKKPFLLSKINPHSKDTLSDFFENLLRFFSKSTCGQWPARMGASEELVALIWPSTRDVDWSSVRRPDVGGAPCHRYRPA